MNRIFLGIISLFVLLFCVQAEAQTFRTFQTTTQEITYTNRLLTNGTMVVETVINTVIVDLTPNPVTAESTTETDETNETLFLTSAAATALQTAIATAEAEATASDTVIAETVAAEVDDTDKAKDTSGSVLESISYVTITDGQVAFNTTDAGTVAEETVTTAARAEFDTVVETVKAIVSQN
ncbi:MAG: hypothetical protein HN584_05485 [Akkermansiaceae bacterium]|nr:hypothetical protein [Akkermansiaceae bacterium]